MNSSATQSRAGLRAAFSEGGERAALQYLNSHTGFRFTSMYRFHGNLLRAICVFDRERPDELSPPPDVPLSATYCLFQKDGNRSIAIDDALQDPRLVNHVAREAVRSYVGVPLRDVRGAIIGSACHFSFEPHSEQVDLEMLETLSDLMGIGSGRFESNAR
ncbi:MAG: GAF domain-containing protein [Tahibacter sp.]